MEAQKTNNEPKKGLCRVSPPKENQFSGYATWPMVKPETDWCGSYAQKFKEVGGKS